MCSRCPGGVNGTTGNRSGMFRKKNDAGVEVVPKMEDYKSFRIKGTHNNAIHNPLLVFDNHAENSQCQFF